MSYIFIHTAMTIIALKQYPTSRIRRDFFHYSLSTVYSHINLNNYLILIISDLCWNLAALRRLGDSAFALRLVFLPTGRISRDLLMGLHVADLVQSALLRLPAVFWIHRACRRLDFLLLGHLLLNLAVIQGNDAIKHGQRWQSAFQSYNHVIFRLP